jgi:hypothetical protein
MGGELNAAREEKKFDHYAMVQHHGPHRPFRKSTAAISGRESHRHLASFDSVWFSRHDALVATAEVSITQARAGYFASELEDILHVPVKGDGLAGDPALLDQKQQRFLAYIQKVSGLPSTQ